MQRYFNLLRFKTQPMRFSSCIIPVVNIFQNCATFRSKFFRQRVRFGVKQPSFLCKVYVVRTQAVLFLSAIQFGVLHVKGDKAFHLCFSLQIIVFAWNLQDCHPGLKLCNISARNQRWEALLWNVYLPTSNLDLGHGAINVFSVCTFLNQIHFFTRVVYFVSCLLVECRLDNPQRDGRKI